MFLNNLYESLELNASSNAFIINEKSYSYTYLSKKASLVQAHLSQLEVLNLEKQVAIICKDDILTYSAIIGIWFLGKGYVPLGLQNPYERNIAILKDAKVKIILTTHPLDIELYKDFVVINLNEISEGESKLIYKPFDTKLVAYTIFTSGSTGTPKGVPISFENLDSFIDAFGKTPVKIGSDDKCLQMFELTFDVSISSFLPALINGACVYTVPNDVIKYIHVLKLISVYKLTVIQIVPSVIHLAKSLLQKMNLPFVKYCILTGEATPIDSFELLKTCLTKAKIYNYYGPTECTIYCSFFDCNSIVKSHNGMLAIGKAFDGITMSIVDEKFNEVGVDVKGELLLAGEQLTLGYLNNPDKNATAFVDLKYNNMVIRHYKTGDICYKDINGDIFYCGRLDNQVKIQGFRIELSEIEICARKLSNLNCIVVVKENKLGAFELILVVETSEKFDNKYLIDRLKEKLPEYMVPNSMMVLKEFPLNSSGKMDRVKIKSMV